MRIRCHLSLSCVALLAMTVLICPPSYGQDGAAKTENLAMVHFAAQIDLDLVDVLEAEFER